MQNHTTTDPELAALRAVRNRHFEQYKEECLGERTIHGEFLVVKLAQRVKTYKGESGALASAARAVGRDSRAARLVMAYADRLVAVVRPEGMEAHFNGDAHKIAAMFASRATGAFMRRLVEDGRLGDQSPLFTATVTPMPACDIVEFLQYTQFGAELFSIEVALADAGVAPEARKGQSRSQRITLLSEAGVNWYDLPAATKRGLLYVRGQGMVHPTPRFDTPPGEAVLEAALGFTQPAGAVGGAL